MRADRIVLDPPTRFETYSEEGRGKCPPYQQMNEAELKSLTPLLRQATNPACIMFLWGTFVNIELSLRLMKAWGWRYVSAIVWGKCTISRSQWSEGTGFYTREAAEIILIGQKRKLDPKNKKEETCSTVATPRGRGLALKPNIFVARRQPEHSGKPEEATIYFEQYPGNGLYVFARPPAPNSKFNNPEWTLLGNEISGNDIRVDLKNYILKSDNVTTVTEPKIILPQNKRLLRRSK